MLEKIKVEIDFNKYMLEDEEKALEETQEKITNEGNVGTIKNLINELEYHKANIEKYKYTLGVLKRLSK